MASWLHSIRNAYVKVGVNVAIAQAVGSAYFYYETTKTINDFETAFIADYPKYVSSIIGSSIVWPVPIALMCKQLINIGI